MISFRPLRQDAPELDLCPLLRAAQLTLEYANAHDGIDLTKGKAFKRVFVRWAAEHFRWPGMGHEELFRYNKVLNEIDFPPLEVTHVLLKALNLGRHYKGRFIVTKQGLTLATDRGDLFAELIPFYLFRMDHSSYSRIGNLPMGNWDIWLNVINVEADHGAAEKHLFKAVYGYQANWADANWREAAGFAACVLKPLEWAGFLDCISASGKDGFTEHHYVKTQLWRRVLELDTDYLLKPILQH